MIKPFFEITINGNKLAISSLDEARELFVDAFNAYTLLKDIELDEDYEDEEDEPAESEDEDDLLIAQLEPVIEKLLSEICKQKECNCKKSKGKHDEKEKA